MAHGQFVWCDVSCFRTTLVRAFYADVMGWHFDTSDGYSIGQGAAGQVCGVFEMPEQFQKIGLPPFWMTYVGTQDLDHTCEIAVQFGGKVEVPPSPFGGDGRFALIRDPLGAGFTAYQGDIAVPTQQRPGHRLGHGLFVSDATAVAPFYKTVFDWDFDSIQDGPIAVCQGGDILCYCHQIPDTARRGKEQYWAVYFDTDDLRRSLSDVKAAGGEIFARTTLPEGAAAFAQDPDGAVFVLVDRGGEAESMLDWKSLNPLEWFT